MVHYPLATEEQKELAEGLRQILEKELVPQLSQLDKEGRYPMDVHKKLADAGYFATGIPEEWGGLGLDCVTQGILCEELAQVDAGFGFGFFMTGNHFSKLIQTSMPDKTKHEWAERMVAGEAMGCLCMTEAEAGSDAAAMRSTAVYDEKTHEWVINGNKCFITNAPLCNYFLVTAWNDKSVSAGKGVTMFFVEKDRGVHVGKHEDKLGIRLTETSEVIFDNVRVPDDHVIGEVGKGFKINMQGVSRSRCFHGCFAVGLAQHATDLAVEYAKTRRQFGKRIIDHEGLGFTIADMQARTDVARSMAMQTLTCIDKGISVGNAPYVTKYMTGDFAMQTATDALQVFGGYGYMKEYPVEKLLRDAKIFQIFGGTSQIQKRTIAKNLAGKDSLTERK